MVYELEIKDAGGAVIQAFWKIDGQILNTNFASSEEEALKVIRNIKNIKIRDDDIMLVSPPKSGKNML